MTLTVENNICILMGLPLEYWQRILNDFLNENFSKKELPHLEKSQDGFTVNFSVTIRIGRRGKERDITLKCFARPLGTFAKVEDRVVLTIETVIARNLSFQNIDMRIIYDFINHFNKSSFGLSHVYYDPDDDMLKLRRSVLLCGVTFNDYMLRNCFAFIERHIDFAIEDLKTALKDR